MQPTSPAPHRKPKAGTEMPAEPKGVKSYNLVIPEDLFDTVQELADKRQTTVVELLRRFIKLGLLVAHVEDTPGAAFIIREGDSEREVIFL